MVQLNPIPVFGAQKRKPVPIDRKFFSKISLQMVSTQCFCQHMCWPGPSSDTKLFMS